jgi:uncharacterized protein (DUF433 family)
MDWREHITVNPAVLHGQACIRGTRIPVAAVLANLADGLSAEEIVKSYPSLTMEHRLWIVEPARVRVRGANDRAV